MHAGTIPEATLADFARDLVVTLPDVWWLAVVLDSNRDVCRGGDLAAFLTPTLLRNGIAHTWTGDGLWLQARVAALPWVGEQLLVEFSVAWLFRDYVAEGLKPRDYKFDNKGQPDQGALLSEIVRLGAMGYFSDGIGLRYASNNGALTRVVESFRAKVAAS